MIFELPRYQCLTADLCLYKAALDLKLTRNSKHQLADFLRYSIRKNADQLVSLEKEIEAMELFLAIERTRYGQRLQVDINCDEKSKSALLPVLILQPLVENAIKYSLHETDKESMINIDCIIKEEELHVEIANNYDEAAITNEGEGIGLENVRARLGLIYNTQDLLKIVNTENMFKVSISFHNYECS